MRILLIPAMLVSLLLSCKQNPKIETPQQATEIEKPVFQLSPSLKEIARFCDLQLSDSADVDAKLNFLLIRKSGTMEKATMSDVITSYNKLIRSGPGETFPVFEIKNTQNAVLTISGKGYGGVIWGKLLVNRNTLEIEKAAFDHKAESEGYGTGITLSSFENQFVGPKISFEENTFGLGKGKNSIDGVSGATVTYKAVVDMVNEGLKNYEPYLNGQQAE